MLKRTILILLIQALLLSNAVQAQDYTSKYCARSFLSAPLNISTVNFQNSFSLISQNETQKFSLKEKTRTIFENNKYPATFTFTLSYGIIDSINNLIHGLNTLGFYASAFLSLSSFIALVVYAYDLFSPQSLLKTLPMRQILQQNWLDSCLLKPDQSAAEDAAEFLAHVKNSRFEWALSAARRGNIVLNLISQGSSQEVRHSLWSHLVLSSEKIRASASLHTHPFESWGTHLHFFPSPNDFTRLKKTKKEKYSDTYLLVFPKQQFPVLLRFKQSPEGKNMITNFVFGKNNVIAVLAAILEGRNFDDIAAKNPQAIITNPAEIIWTQNESRAYYFDFSYLPAEHPQIKFLLNLRGQKKQKPSNPQSAARNTARKQSKLNDPQLPSFYPLSPQQQNALDFSI